MKDDQVLILVDENDNFQGYARRDECHTGLGKRHRAFETLLIDNDNKVILQKRKHALFDNLWDFTAISHPIHLETGDEDYQEASDKALLREMNIPPIPVKKIGGFNYFIEEGKHCENEYCAVLVGKHDGEFSANPQEAYETKKVPLDQFLSEVKEKPQNFTVWAQKGAEVIEENAYLFDSIKLEKKPLKIDNNIINSVK